MLFIYDCEASLTLEPARLLYHMYFSFVFFLDLNPSTTVFIYANSEMSYVLSYIAFTKHYIFTLTSVF